MLKAAWRVLLTGLEVAALMAFILLVVPDGNDYAQVTLDKHERLDKLTGPKLVFVGGSNLAYGLDSPTVERALGRAVVNMGMNAYFGVRFMLEEVAPSLRAGDVVVLSLENEMFRVQDQFDAADGRNTDLLMMVKTRPASLAYVPWPLRRRIVAAIPEAVQRKTLRVLGDVVRSDREPKLMDKIESRAGFNAHGDLVSHIGMTWAEPLDRPPDLSSLPLEPRVFTLLHDFRERLDKQGVRLVFVPPPMPQQYYDAHVSSVQSAASALDRAVPGLRLAPQSRYVFPESCFFDDIHHLTGECRLVRTERVIEDLRSTLETATASGARVLDTSN